VQRFGFNYRVGDKVMQVESNYDRETFARRDALCHHLHELGRGLPGIGCLDKIKVEC
jgi:hypothetical protein